MILTVKVPFKHQQDRRESIDVQRVSQLLSKVPYLNNNSQFENKVLVSVI